MYQVPEIVQVASAIEKEKILSIVNKIIHVEEIQELNHRYITIQDNNCQIIFPNYFAFISKHNVTTKKFNLTPFLAKIRLRELFPIPTTWNEIKELFLNIPVKNLQSIKEYDLHFYFQCLDILYLI
jgi:hypothetical protein